MADTDGVSILDQSSSKISTAWTNFLALPDVKVDLHPSPASGPVTAFSCKNERFKDLPFNSSKNGQYFAGKSGYSVGDKDDGVLMALDWDGKKPPTGDTPKYLEAWTLREALDAFSVDIPKDGLMNKILTAIGPLENSDVIKDAERILQVDTTEPYSGMWLIPGNSLEVSTRLSFKLVVPQSSMGIATALKEEFGLNLVDIASSFSIHLQQMTFGIPSVKGLVTTTAFKLIVVAAIKEFLFWVEYTDSGISCTLTEDPNFDTGFVKRLEKLGPGNSLDTDTVTPVFDDVFSKIDLWTVTVGRDLSGSVYFLVELLVHWQTSGNPFIVGLTYDSRSKTFTGRLLFQSSFPSKVEKALPSYDQRREKPPKIDSDNSNLIDKLKDNLSLTKLFSDSATAPEGFPTIVTMAMVSYSPEVPAVPPAPASDAIPGKLYFSATIVAPGAGTKGDDPPTPFTWDAVAVNAAYVKGSGVSFDIFTSFSLNPRKEDLGKYSRANLAIDLQYSKGTWHLSGSVENLQFGVLGGYFHKDLSNAVLSVLGKVAIKTLDIDYTFASTSTDPSTTNSSPSKSSSFILKGVIVIGDLELDLIYQYASSTVVGETAAQKKLKGGQKASKAKAAPTEAGKSEWFFEADLGASSPDATIGSIADSFVDNASDSLPDFVKKIPINPPKGGSSPISLTMASVGKTSIACTLKIHIDMFELTLVQIAGKDTPTKRLFRLTVDKIPMIDTIPLIKELPQPFEKLVYMYVLDSSKLGWTSDDLDTVNKQIGDSSSNILAQGTTNEPGPTKAAIVEGHHFMIIDGGKVILDHVFGQTTEKPKEQALDKDGKVEGSTSPPKADEVAPTKGALAKKTSTLSISNVGLQYKQGTLWIMLDATLALGPIEITLLGFGIGLPIGNKFDKEEFTLDKLGSILGHMEFQIHGLGVAFEQPPLVLAGVFEHEVIQKTESYRGGIAVSFPPYMFVAVGEYSITHDDKEHEYKSVFVFAKLNGPLITLEFATISGVRLGFGYNSMVRSPAIEELTDFPFINDGSQEGAGNNPIEILKSMTKPPKDGVLPWVSPKQDSYWFAVGMTISAFDLLNVTAVAMLAFKDSGVIASIYADGIATMPPGAKPSGAILYVELGMVAEMNFVEDYFRVEASLAPTSFLLVPQCHLYGGFALCYWYGRNPHAGDWVFTVGGYHKAFSPPSWYPTVKRLGVNFQVGGGLSVTAEAYFAITPKAVMGGAMLHVSLDVGPVSAYLDASFDAIINFHPIHYMVDMRIAVGVSCDINVLFIHIHIHVQIGADLHIEGPEFGGVAQYVCLTCSRSLQLTASSVDFYIFGFDVNFGAQNSIPDPIDLPTFYEIIHKAGPDPNPAPPDRKGKDDKTTDTMKHLKFCLENGAFPMPARDNKADSPDASKPPSAGTGSMWHVKGGSFQFRIACDFALSAAHVQIQDKVEKVDSTGKKKTTSADKFEDVPTIPLKDKAKLKPVCAKPCAVTKPIDSILTVRIISQEHGTLVFGFVTTFVQKPVPTAMWQQYDPVHDPMRSDDPKKLREHLFSPDNPAVMLAMGVSLMSPPPLLAKSPIPQFDITAARTAPVLDLSVTPFSKVWILAKTEDPQGGRFLPDTDNVATKAEERAGKWDATRAQWEKAFDAELVGDGKKITKTDDRTLAGKGMLGMCAKVLGWDNPDPAQQEDVARMDKDVRRPWELRGAVPEKLVRGKMSADGKERTGGLEEFYLALPQFCAVAT